jgi:hypothetical protein
LPSQEIFIVRGDTFVMPTLMASTQEPDLEYSGIAFTVVADDVTLPGLYEEAHECYFDPEDLDELTLDKTRPDARTAPAAAVKGFEPVKSAVKI